MADGGEGEDEIQFLRTVSAARLGFPRRGGRLEGAGASAGRQSAVGHAGG